MTDALRRELEATFGGLARRPTVADVTDYNGAVGATPVAVLTPETTEDVAAIIGHCVAARLAMVPQGGRTGLAGGAVPGVTRSVIVSLSKLNTIRAIDTVGRTATVDAGCTVDNLDAAAAGHSLTFPFAIGSGGSAQIGGILSTNAGGIRAWRHGGARQLAIGVEAVLPNGSMWSSLRRVRKASMGPDLGHLLIGAEGTLGIITGAAVELKPRKAIGPTAFAAVRSVEDAVALFVKLDVLGELDAFELMSQAGLTRVAAAGEHLPLRLDHRWYILAEWAGTHADAADQLADVGDLVADGVVAAGERQRAGLWRIRGVHGSACRRDGLPRQHDVAVPRSAIAAFMAEAMRLAESCAPRWQPVPIAHLGDGNVHFDLIPRESGTAPEWEEALSAAIHDLAQRLGGAFSAEHGIGTVRMAELHRLMPPGNRAALAAVKQALDPLNLMNPGKVVPPRT